VASIGALAFFFAATLYFYKDLAAKPFSLDDPTYLLNAGNSSEASFIQSIFGSTAANRFRPVSDITQYLAFKIAGENSTLWWIINCALIAVCAFILSYAVNKTFRPNLISLFIGISLITSRFLQYNASQVIGVMESTNNILILLIAIFVQKHSHSKESKHLLTAIFLFMLICFSHERFQTLILAFLVYILLVTRKEKKKALLLIGYLVFPIALLASVKLVLDFPQLVGTGSVTELGFRWDTTFMHACFAFLQIFGINFGPGYLVGVSFEFGPTWLQVLGVLVFTCGLVICAKYLSATKSRHKAGADVSLRVFWPLLFCSALLPGLVTIRLEQRWLMAPMIILMLVASRFLADKEKVKRLISSVFLLGYLAMNFFYVANSSSIFFRGTQDYAVKLLATLGDAWVESSRSANEIVLIAKDDPKGLADYIEKVMRSNTPIESGIVGYPNLTEAQGRPRAAQEFVFEYDSRDGSLVQLTSPVKIEN
jgi:hypothetical protein